MDQDENILGYAHYAILRPLQHMYQYYHRIVASKYTFSSNHNVPQSSCGLFFWVPDPLIDGFY